MRLVLDTNVVVSALLWRGTPYRLLQTIRRDEHVLLIASAALPAELAEVLIRPVPQKRLSLLGRLAHEALGDYSDAVELVAPTLVPSVVATDADDDHVIAAAVASQADLIVSGDHHLLDLSIHQGIRIVTPIQAISLISAV